MRILVTDCTSRSALAATRSLGRQGHTVITAGERRGLAAASRFSQAFLQYPSPLSDPDGFVEHIVRAVQREHIDLLLPMTEVTTLLLTSHRVALPASCTLPFASPEAIALASDKSEMIALANQINVPTPVTVRIESVEHARELLAQLAFPLVIKPARSRVRTPKGWLSSRVSYASDAAELLETLQRLDPALFPVLLQERIRGPGVGFFACYDHGRLVAQFAHLRLREKPPSGGVSVLCESTAVDADALEYGTRLLDHLQWHGVAMVEFKRDERDGSLRLMEINARFWGSLHLAILAGVDFPGILARMARGEHVEAIDRYRLGVRSRWLLGDLDALLMVLTRSRERLNLPPDFPSRGRMLLDFCRFWQRGTHYEVMTSDDRGPGWLELREWFANL